MNLGARSWTTPSEFKVVVIYGFTPWRGWVINYTLTSFGVRLLTIFHTAFLVGHSIHYKISLNIFQLLNVRYLSWTPNSTVVQGSWSATRHQHNKLITPFPSLQWICHERQYIGTEFNTSLYTLCTVSVEKESNMFLRRAWWNKS